MADLIARMTKARVLAPASIVVFVLDSGYGIVVLRVLFGGGLLVPIPGLVLVGNG